MSYYEQTQQMLNEWRTLRAKLRLFESTPTGASYSIAILVLNLCIMQAEHLLTQLSIEKDVEKKYNEAMKKLLGG
jgi:hypothetical protein